MRKSQTRTGNRPLRAGIATAATAVLAVAGVAAPAYAVAVDGTLSATTAPIGGGTSVTLSATGAFTGITTNIGGRFVASTASCAATYGTTGTSNLAVTVAATDANTATITVPALAVGIWKACVYGATSGTLGTATPVIAQSTNFLTVNGANTKPVLNPAAGTSAGGTSVTATGTGAYLTTGAATLGLTFRTTACSNTYSATAPIVATTATKTSATVATFTVPATLPAAGTYNVCIYAGTTGTSILLGNASYAALPTATLSPTSGNSAGGNSIILTTKTAAVTSSTPSALFTKSTSCPVDVDSIGGSDAAATTTTRISTSKVAIEVPTGVVHDGTGETTAYNVCLYANGTDGKLLAVPPTYSVATTLDLTSVGIVPTGGPAQGGSTIEVTVAGGLPTDTDATVSASLGGSALENIEVQSDTTFTATTTAHAAGATKLSVTTAAGTQVSSTDEFTFSYGVTSTPNTAPAGSTSVTLDILGSGFDSLTFNNTAQAGASTPPGNGVGVFLVANGWYALVNTANTVVSTGLVSQCMGVIKISDTELICTLDLTKSLNGTGYYVATPVTAGVYNVAVVNDSDAADQVLDTNFSRISSGSVFTVADY